jgi:hypothetical protein
MWLKPSKRETIHDPSQCGHLRKYINEKEKYFKILIQVEIGGHALDQTWVSTLVIFLWFFGS